MPWTSYNFTILHISQASGHPITILYNSLDAYYWVPWGPTFDSLTDACLWCKAKLAD